MFFGKLLLVIFLHLVKLRRVASVSIDYEKEIGIFRPKVDHVIELNHVKKYSNNDNDPLEDVVQKVRIFITSRKLLYDTFATVAMDGSHGIKRQNMDNISGANGKIFKLFFDDTDIVKPNSIRFRLAQAKEKQDRKDRKTIYVKKLKARNILYRKPLYYGFRQNVTNQLVFNGPLVISSKQVYASDVTASQQATLASSQGTNDHIRQLKLSKNTIIDSMAVQFINNINFVELYGESFLKNRDNTVNGSVKLRAQESGQTAYTHIKDLTANILNQRRINYFFTQKTKQIIETALFVSKFLAHNISVGTLNSIDVRTIALTGANNIFASSIRIENLNITGNLSLSVESVGSFKDQVRMASKLEKFSQFYQGQVSIKGQLVVKNLLSMPNTKISIGASKIKQTSVLKDLSQRFWMKNIAQNFSASIYFMTSVKFDNLFSTEINDKPHKTFLFKSNHSYPAQLFSAANIKIVGDLENDVVAEKKEGSIRIEQLSSNLVYRSIQFNEILGRKVFEFPSTIWHLYTRKIILIDVSHLVYMPFSIHSIQFMNANNVSNINVTKSFMMDSHFEVRIYNEKSVPKFFQLAATIDQQLIASQKLRFVKAVAANNMQINYMNQLTLPMSTDENYHVPRGIIINANVLFSKNLQVHKLNRIHWKEYSAVLTLCDMDTNNVGGNKIFLKPVLVYSALNVKELNNYESERIDKVALKNSVAQILVAAFEFESLSTKVLETKSTIGDTNVKLLMRSDANINIGGSLMVRTIKLRGSLFGIHAATSMAYDRLSRLRQVEKSKWALTNIRYNVDWPSSDALNTLDYDGLVNFAIRRELEQEIVAKVKFKALPEFLFSLTEYDLAGLDISNIVADSLAQNQNYLNITLSGSKYFELPIEITDSVHFKRNLDIGLINGIDILYLNQTFYRKNVADYQKLYSRKGTCTSVRMGNLIINGLVNSVNIIKVMFIGLEHNGIPYVKFTESIISMKTMEVSYLNRIHFPAFIQGRVRISGEKQIINGSLTMDSVRMKKAVFTKINGCRINRCLFKELKKHQIIHSNKKFLNPLLVIGPSSMLNVNGIELIRKYETTLRLNQNLKFKTVEISEEGNAALHYGLKIIGHLNSVATNQVHNVSHLQEQLHRVKKQSVYDFPANQRSKFLYLELRNFSSVEISTKNVSEFIEFDAVCPNPTSYTSMVKISVPFMLKSEYIPLQKSHSYAEHLRLVVGNKCSSLNSKLEIKLNKTQCSFNFSKAIESIQLFDSTHDDFIYMIINFFSRESAVSISLYRIDLHNASVTHIQEINHPKRSNLTASFQIGISRQWILLLSADEIIVYAFSPHLEQFYEISSHELQYNQIAFLPDGIEQDSYQLIFANRRDRSVAVKMGNEGYKFQEIHLPEPLSALATFYESDLGEMIMIILMEDGNFYLFKYLSNVEGWVYETAGVTT